MTEKSDTTAAGLPDAVAIPLALAAMTFLVWAIYALATAPACIDSAYFEGLSTECNHWSGIDYSDTDRAYERSF